MRLLGPGDIMNGQVVDFRRGFHGYSQNEISWTSWQRGVMFRQDHRRTTKRDAHTIFTPRINGMPQTPEYRIEHWHAETETWRREDQHWLQIRLVE